MLAPVDKSIQVNLIDNGVDPILARHIAHLFIRDPLVIFSETLDPLDDDTMEHFEVCVTFNLTVTHSRLLAISLSNAANLHPLELTIN